MKWLSFALSSLPAALLGLLAGGYIGARQISWFRLSEANGTQYYRVIALAMLFGIVGLVAGLIIARQLSVHDTASSLRAATESSGGVLALAAVVFGVSRYFGHVPPTIDGQQLTLQVEIRLPPGHAKPVVPTQNADGSYRTYASFFYLISVDDRIGRYFGFQGDCDEGAARDEGGRWILPGHLLLETSQGKRLLEFHVVGVDMIRLIAPIPAHPGAESMQWSGWLPERDDAGRPWPDSKPSYRFRVQKVEPRKEVATRDSDEASDFARDEARLNAIPSDAPLTAYFEFTRYNAPERIKLLAMDRMAARPTFASDMKALMLSADADEAGGVLRLIERVPHPTNELIAAVEFVGQDLAERMRTMNATPAKDDPDFLRANDVALRFYGWINAVAKLRAKDGGNFIPELRTIVELSRIRGDLEVIRRDVRRVAVSVLADWAGVPPQPGDPKP